MHSPTHPPPHSLILAHRGASAEAPENTLAAFRLAWRQGAGGIELDVHLSRDGRIVVCHDANTLRTTGRACVIAETDWTDLAPLDAGSWKGFAWRGERLPLLAEVLAENPPGRAVYIEIKCGVEILPPLARLLEGHPAARDVRFLCFDANVLRAAKAATPRHACLLNIEPPKSGWQADSVIQTVRAAGLDGASLGLHASIHAALISRLHGAGLKVAVWTCDDPVEARRLRSAGIDVLMTNAPGKIG